MHTCFRQVDACKAFLHSESVDRREIHLRVSNTRRSRAIYFHFYRGSKLINKRTTHQVPPPQTFNRFTETHRFTFSPDCVPILHRSLEFGHHGQSPSRCMLSTFHFLPFSLPSSTIVDYHRGPLDIPVASDYVQGNIRRMDNGHHG